MAGYAHRRSRKQFRWEGQELAPALFIICRRTLVAPPPPPQVLPGRCWRYGERHMPAPMAKHYAELRGQYRVFNTAGYQFYRTLGSIPVPGVDLPFATNASLPHTPADTWGDRKSVV